MPAGETTLALSDIPFFYSVVNIVFIIIHGSLENYTDLLPVALFAGLGGTFLVTTHPIQRGFDRLWRQNIKENIYSNYLLSPPRPSNEGKYTIDQAFLRLSLRTVAIKYEKDKIAASLYFVITLFAILSAMLQDNFIKAMGIEYLSPIYITIIIVIAGMLSITGWISSKELTAFNGKLKLQALFFRLYRSDTNSDVLTLAKAAIDQGDWVTAKEVMDQFIRLKGITSL